jgi:hypothetical protein
MRWKVNKRDKCKRLRTPDTIYLHRSKSNNTRDKESRKENNEIAQTQIDEEEKEQLSSTKPNRSMLTAKASSTGRTS